MRHQEQKPTSLDEMSKVNFRGPNDLPHDLTIMQLKERERNVVYSPEQRPHQQENFRNRPQRPD